MFVWDRGCVKSPLEARDGGQLLAANLPPVVFFSVKQTSEAAFPNLKQQQLQTGNNHDLLGPNATTACCQLSVSANHVTWWQL